MSGLPYILPLMSDASAAPSLAEPLEAEELLAPPVTWTPTFDEYHEATLFTVSRQQKRGGVIFALLTLVPLAAVAALLAYPLLVTGRRRQAAVTLVQTLQPVIPFVGIFVLAFLFARLTRTLRRGAIVAFVLGVVLACVAAQVASGLVVGSVFGDGYGAWWAWAGLAWVAFAFLRQTFRGGVYLKLWNGEPSAREERTVALRAEGVQTDMMLHALLNRWPGIVGVSETRSCLLLHTGAYGCVVVAKRAFADPAAYQHFAQTARDSAGRRTAFEVVQTGHHESSVSSSP